MQPIKSELTSHHNSVSKDKIFNIVKINKEHCLNSEFLKSFISKENNDECIRNNNILNNSKEQKIEFNFDGLLNALINIKYTNSVNAFHLNFLEFKKVLNFKRKQRKTKLDSVLKKCKSKFFRAVQESLKLLIPITLYNIYRLPQCFITNVNIDYNKYFMNKSLLQIYLELNSVQNYNNVIYCKNPNQEMLLKRILSMTYEELFDQYVNSQRFKEDCEAIKEKEGEKYEILYKYVSKMYVHYYALCKGNKMKHKRK